MSVGIGLLCELILVTTNKNIKILLKYVVGPLVFCLLAWSIYRQLLRQNNWQQSLQHAWQAMRGAEAWKLMLAIALMLANWGLESRKWQVVIKRVQQLSF